MQAKGYGFDPRHLHQREDAVTNTDRCTVNVTKPYSIRNASLTFPYSSLEEQLAYIQKKVVRFYLGKHDEYKEHKTKTLFPSKEEVQIILCPCSSKVEHHTFNMRVRVQFPAGTHKSVSYKWIVQKTSNF